MDLSSPKVSGADKLSLCKKYFFAGFAFLPFLWAVNAVWFFKEAFVKEAYPEQATIKKLVTGSFIGALVYFVAFVAWIVVFANHRSEWGALGDALSFNIPTGSP